MQTMVKTYEEGLNVQKSHERLSILSDGYETILI